MKGFILTQQEIQGLRAAHKSAIKNKPVLLKSSVASL